jgi:hypothetical protein
MLGVGLGAPAYGFAGGTGEPNDPYQIATAADLLSIGSNSKLLSKCFVLINDIDLDPNLPGGRVFNDALIGRDSNPSVTASSGSFRGVFDGQGHTIRHLHVAGKYGYDAGLFGISSGLIENLHLEDVRISGAPCGGLVGLSSVGGMILRCSVTGQVAGSYCVGGLVGRISETLMVGCESRADVIGDANSLAGGLAGSVSGFSAQIIECRAGGTVVGGTSVGGLIGWTSLRTTILRCGAAGRVVADGAAGGLIGEAFSELTIADCYARGSVTGSTAGGLIGNTHSGVNTYILNSYAACPLFGRAGATAPPLVGGLFGRRDWDQPAYLITGCLWDAELSRTTAGTGLTLADFGTGLTTQALQQRTTFEQAGWDFGYTWVLPPGDYPVLQWEMAQDKKD